VTSSADPSAPGRRIEWATRTLTEGEALAAFARHCRDDLDDVEVVEVAPTRLVARWRRETSRVELAERISSRAIPESDGPTLLLGDIEADLDALVEAFVSDAGLRSRLAIVDLVRLEKINAVRSSVFVYFEWFLRDEYGVKILPEPTFTSGLVERGIISLGMG
jgi:hypothetical protein